MHTSLHIDPWSPWSSSALHWVFAAVAYFLGILAVLDVWGVGAVAVLDSDAFNLLLLFFRELILSWGCCYFWGFCYLVDFSFSSVLAETIILTCRGYFTDFCSSWGCGVAAGSWVSVGRGLSFLRNGHFRPVPTIFRKYSGCWATWYLFSSASRLARYDACRYPPEDFQ